MYRAGEEGQRETKTKNPTKRAVGKKKFFGKFGARESRPMSPTKKALRVALRATSTSGKVLHDEHSTTYALI